MLKALLKAILPPEDKKFYELFEAGALVAAQAAELYRETIREFLNEERFQRAMDLKHRSSDISKLTLAELNNTFITPIDRDDILRLSYLLDKIVKRVIRACANLRVYRLSHHPDKMRFQAETLVKSTSELCVVVALLRKNAALGEVSASNNRMRVIEHEGDEILFQAMEDFFSGNHDALTVIKLRDTARNIESALDTCSAVSESIVNIVLKQS